MDHCPTQKKYFESRRKLAKIMLEIVAMGANQEDFEETNNQIFVEAAAVTEIKTNHPDRRWTKVGYYLRHQLKN